MSMAAVSKPKFTGLDIKLPVQNHVGLHPIAMYHFLSRLTFRHLELTSEFIDLIINCFKSMVHFLFCMSYNDSNLTELQFLQTSPSQPA